MQITTKTEYAVRALSELAQHDENHPISVREICKKQFLPRKYIEQLFRKLRQQGIIKSVHGATGGYFIAVKPEDVTLYDIMQGVEENYRSVKCEKESGEKPPYCKGMPCGFYSFWSEITDYLTSYFKSKTLADVLKKLPEEA